MVHNKHVGCSVTKSESFNYFLNAGVPVQISAEHCGWQLKHNLWCYLTPAERYLEQRKLTEFGLLTEHARVSLFIQLLFGKVLGGAVSPTCRARLEIKEHMFFLLFIAFLLVILYLYFLLLLFLRGTLFEVCVKTAKTIDHSWLGILSFHCVYNDVHRPNTYN